MQQLNLALTSNSNNWSPDDWETPDRIAIKIANFVDNIGSNLQILEPFAGSGQIVKQLTRNHQVTAVEIKHDRYTQGKSNIPKATWVNDDFTEYADDLVDEGNKYDVIVSNPPFSLGFKYVDQCFDLLKDNGRLFLLLPLSFPFAKSRNQELKTLGLGMSIAIGFVGRIGYLKDGVAVSSRQEYDVLWEIVREGGVNFVAN